MVTHSFLVIPECPYPLLGRDLLTKLGAQIHFSKRGAQVLGEDGRPIQILTVSLQDEYRLFETPIFTSPPDNWLQEFPQAWAETGGLGLAKFQTPIIVDLKPTAVPVSIKQYPMSREARMGIQQHVNKFLELGVLRPCRSPWNTPLLPVKKPGTQDYRPVQDLREINKRTMDIHPTVPNPYNLLSTLRPDHNWYTVLDLKDAFFCLPLAPQSQELFAFEWRDPERGISGQLTWTRLPQGFKNSPTLFDEALHRDLTDFRTQHPDLTLLQYVDDLLLAAPTKEACLQGTRQLLRELGEKGYRASAKKAQICQTKVTYLGYILSEGKRWLTPGRIETVARIPPPRSPKEVREFLGTAGFCRLWIPGFAELAAPLYALTKGNNPFTWLEEHQQAFETLKKALLSAPALGLPDTSKPFTLYADERRGIAKGVLTQKLGPWKRPVAYLSKKLDPVAAGWPPCLRIMAATAMLVKDSAKLTLEQPLTVITPHTLEAIVRQPPDRWITNARLTHYQALLLDTDRVRFGPPVTLNPATLLPVPEVPLSPHDCRQVLAETHGTREDLQDYELPDADHTWYTDGSSFMDAGTRRAGAAVVDGHATIWAQALPPGTSAQKAELIALTKALELSQGKKANIYTDSRYAFATAHTHGSIYERRGLLTSEGKEIKNKAEIIALLKALFLPKKVAIIHCPGHQKGHDPVAQGNRQADQAARQVARIETLTLISETKKADRIPPSTSYTYTPEDREEAIALGATENQETKNWEKYGKTVLPQKQAMAMVQQMHAWTHLSSGKLKLLIEKTDFLIPRVGTLLEQITLACKACQQVNAGATRVPAGIRTRGNRPGTYWEVDFTEIKPHHAGYKYLLVFIDTFSGWVEAYPTRQETAHIVAKKILEEIFPRFGLPKVIGSDNGPAFVSQVSQGLARILGINWKLHCAYRPQSSGQVERVNRTIKETLAKLTLETGLKDWRRLLSLALLRARNTPNRFGLTPYEILYGGPPPLSTLLDSFSPSNPKTDLQARLKGLQAVQAQIWAPLAELYQPGHPQTSHPFQVGDSVYVRRHRSQGLEPRWKGLYIVLLTTPTAVKVDGVAAWIHASHVKAAPKVPGSASPEKWRLRRSRDPLKIRLARV
ncbi:BTB/POZ domain-containing protein KCTD7 isoform X1 [Pan paniscus]